MWLDLLDWASDVTGMDLAGWWTLRERQARVAAEEMAQVRRLVLEGWAEEGKRTAAFNSWRYSVDKLREAEAEAWNAPAVPSKTRKKKVQPRSSTDRAAVP